MIAGHVDSRRGPAVFYRLGELRRGDVVVVRYPGRVEARFRVERTERHPKRAFPTGRVYGDTAGRRCAWSPAAAASTGPAATTGTT